MNAGPYPTKEMMQRLQRGTAGLFHAEDVGGGYTAYTPMYQLSSGVAVGVDNNDGSEGAAPPAPIKVLELSWENVPVMFEALALVVRPGEMLTAEDIAQLDIVPLDANHPARPDTPWLPRQGWQLAIFDLTAQDLPLWVRELGNNALGTGNVILALAEEFRPLALTGQTIRVTFTGQGTLKLKDGVGRPTTRSHPGVVLRALDAQGAVVTANLAATTMGRRTPGNHGFVEPGNMPLRPAPSQEFAAEQGAEIVWPPNGGAPYLHIFRRRSGGGVESHHIPSIPGLPQ